MTVGGRHDIGRRRTEHGWRIAAQKMTVAWATDNQRIMQGA
jgi:hypothetical protein